MIQEIPSPNLPFCKICKFGESIFGPERGIPQRIIKKRATMSEVPPTRMNQQIFKVKKKAAEGGYKLLKKKADALKVRSRRKGGA